MEENLGHSSAEQKNDKQDKIYWHDGFFAALQLELNDYKDALAFEDAHQLSKEALEIDVLIIKKLINAKIDKNIGKIFKNHNIVEFKSEKDNLSVWDYNKVAGGYAMLYSAFERVLEQDITVSFVVTPKPEKLFEHLIIKRNFTITEPNPGIYYIEGDAFPVQIIETKKLTAKENVFLKNLRSTLTQNEVIEVLDAKQKYGSLDKVDIYLSRVLDANISVFEEVLAMSSAAVREVLDRHILKHGVPASIEERIEGRIEERVRVDEQEKTKRITALEMLKDGLSPDKIARYVQKPIEWVQGLV
jgi:hypothetical protein